MANPTTYFGWVMPTSTDLVTDLPADFNVFGQGVDTSMQDLLGGTTGQILSKTSATNMDFTWINNDQGDITGVTAGTGITGGGTSGAVTITNDMATTITAAGDIVVGTGSGTYDNLPIGTSAQVLTADTTVSPYKVKWATPAGGGKVLQVVQDTLTTSYTTTSTSFGDTGLEVTITPTSATSKIMVYVSVPSADATLSGTGGLGYGAARLLVGATVLQYNETGSYNVASATNPSFLAAMSMSYLDSPATTSATTYKVQAKKETGTSFAFIASATRICSIVVMEIGA